MSTSSQVTSQTVHEEAEVQGVPAGLCPRFHRAVELVGRRWTGAIIRVLLPGPHRFNELLAAIPGISDRLLTERLRDLVTEHIIARETRPGTVSYSLTQRGRELQEALDALGRWAERWMD